ncbi:hypothetical protein LYSHEL_06640 [Lysobacter helvus]|uniref:Uncharacterized protein n=2 Tax=Lysobacteraceae TaxID=32033 RepID=A0ABN6FPU9_9GAMM|nr:hypothetical protein LYSCAS_06640 [Lysobacter caseinilyticus]BCT94793.1 hypothetical protein LYSHEL_06640 [Lysobacter helvus]
MPRCAQGIAHGDYYADRRAIRAWDGRAGSPAGRARMRLRRRMRRAPLERNMRALLLSFRVRQLNAASRCTHHMPAMAAIPSDIAGIKARA